VLGSDEEFLGDATVIFEEKMLARLRVTLSEQALKTPLFFTDRLSDRSLAVFLTTASGVHAIAFNVRFKIDPEWLAHALVEEYVHAQQTIDGLDAKSQREQFSYTERPYEQEAKRVATELLGYEPENREPIILRQQPEGALFDLPQRQTERNV
jgi:hypothetical protein